VRGPSELTFLLQVSRPGALEHYGVVLSDAAGPCGFFAFEDTLAGGSSMFCFPLGFLLYGVNDIVDAEADRLIRVRGHFYLGRWAGQNSWQLCDGRFAAVQIPFLILFFILVGAASIGLVWCVIDCRLEFTMRRGLDGRAILRLMC